MSGAPFRRLFYDKRSIKFRLVVSFCVLSIFPVIVAQVAAYYNMAGILQRKFDAMERANLVQTGKILSTKLDFYEDLLYQMYTDDRLIDLMKRLNAGEDVEFTSGQLRRALHTYIYTMPYVQSITVLTSSGRMVFDDLLTGYNTKTSWLDASTDRPARLFASIAYSAGTIFFPSEPASLYAVKRHNLFHLGHRFVEIRDVWRRSGVILLSIDEHMLSEICDERFEKGSGAPTAGSICLLSDDGTIVSHPDESLVSKKIALPSDLVKRNEAIKRIASSGDKGNSGRLSLYELHESKTGWSIIAVLDLDAIYRDISNQQRLTIVVILSTVALLLAIILFITDRLTRSISTVVAAMNVASAGDLSTRIEIGEDMPFEVERIAENFNSMIGKIGELICEVQSALTKQRNAEIAALEAQVNPHFLYNTLDMINWMAIDKDEFEISNAIGALADILRYGIDDSNGEVEIRQEVEWLKKYVTLQQTRLKGVFGFRLDLDPSALDLRIHKMLLQPFVENSIVHGFKRADKAHELSISIAKDEGRLLVTIADNGCGIEAVALREIMSGARMETGSRGHIGMYNAIERIKMYYRSETVVEIDSAPGEGTRVRIALSVAELQ
jgi:two-component system sensor histidine kinase YesM